MTGETGRNNVFFGRRWLFHLLTFWKYFYLFDFRHYWIPKCPQYLLDQCKNFDGELFHSRYYDDPSDYRNKTVVIVGAHSSGLDIAMEISEYADKVHKKFFASFGVSSVYISLCLFQI